jgi:hemerythrin
MISKIRKVDVATGVFWVEVPEADLRILCGCPADSVKYLMRRGLIVPTEAKGIPFETGPNAILLSDVMLQNGNFSNLAEFPILQMLYRQGMIVPNHPNNTGRKPLLIGRHEQVNAQLQYIYRGNYGLVSSEEMIATGVPAATAEDWMRLKLRFAFGSIRSSRELVEGIALGDRPVTLPGGVQITRTGLNVFEFRYDDEAVVVDLNLASDNGSSYDSPFSLGSHMVRREYFSVLHTGDGDGWDPNRPSMGSVLMFQGRFYLVDAGPSLAHQMTALGIGINEIDGLFLTHAHDDHFAGITTLLKADHRIKVFAAPVVWASAAKKLAALLSAEEADFQEYFDVVPLEIGRWNNIEGLEVLPVFSPHPVETTIMHFRALWAGGYRTYAHFADIVSLKLLHGMIEPDATKPGVSQSFYDKIAADYAIPADVKKLDIGGGMIHGSAQDFRDDTSKKLILAHAARQLTADEKEIGSGAPFGTCDVLIQGQQDFTWRNGFVWLEAYFPTVPAYELRVLLNSPTEVFNPETILQREGAEVPAVHLILTGTVEMIRDGRPSGLLASGAMVGEVALIAGRQSDTTYRAVSFVNSFAIPADLYRTFVDRNGLLEEIRALQERRAFLRSTRLCADAVSNVVLNHIARQMARITFAAGETIIAEGQVLLVASGQIERRLGTAILETLTATGAFGEESIFDAPPLARTIAVEPTVIYAIPAAELRHVPVIRWKLLELFDRRLRGAVTHTADGEGPFRGIVWRDEYSVEIGRIDAHHRKLFDRANCVFATFVEGGDRSRVVDALDFLVDYAKFHFHEEEALMASYAYECLDAHRDFHRKLLDQVEDMRTHFRDSGNGEDKDEQVMDLLRHWIIDHILVEDRRFAARLNAKGVF